MTDEELDALLEELESALLADVQAALALTAQEFAEALDGATELVAARFSVSGIKDMWKRRVGGIMDRLKAITGRAAQVTADELGDELPDGWDDQLSDYVTATQALLDAVGDRLAAEASGSLAEGLNAGEDVDQLRDRLAALFAEDGTQLGTGRADRIATTEATRAWNAGTLAAAQALTGPDRPLVKQWVTRMDARVRDAHRDTNGQLQLLDDPFDVTGVPMQYPGDPTAPAALTVGCRCILRTATAPERTDDVSEGDDLSAAADVHTGAMIALMPTEGDAARLGDVLNGGESADQLHLTLYYLGDAVDWTAEQQGHLISRVSYAARLLTPIGGRAFGAAQWNPASDEPAWVWNVGNDHDTPGSTLENAKYEITYALEDGHDDPELPQQYTPWSPHICAAYGRENLSEVLTDGVGPVTFDRVRVAFAGQYTDIPLSGGYFDELADEPLPEPVEETIEQPPQLLTWSTPPGIALAFENQQTGDGRVFAPGSLYWEGSQWPLQYADEMNGGHDGARLAGAIFSMGRDEARLTGNGVLYLTQSAGVESAMLLAQGAPLGVSVDLDDVSLELVSLQDDVVYTASLATASLTPLADGGFHMVGDTIAEWTASGSATVGESSRMDFVVSANGAVPAAAFELVAAAGDNGEGGVVVDRQVSGEVLMRITRARVRGATLVTIPAYSDARIVLDNPELFASVGDLTAASSTDPYERVVRHVRKALIPVTAGDAAKFLHLPVSDVRRYLGRAAKRGVVVRIAHGRYVRPNEQSASGVPDMLSACAKTATKEPASVAVASQPLTESAGTQTTATSSGAVPERSNPDAAIAVQSLHATASGAPTASQLSAKTSSAGTTKHARLTDARQQPQPLTRHQTRGSSQTSSTTSGARTGSPTNSSTPCSTVKADAAPSVPSDSTSWTARAADTFTWTTTTTQAQSGQSSASSVTRDSDTSGTTPSGSNAQPPTFDSMDGNVKITPKIDADWLDELAASGDAYEAQAYEELGTEVAEEIEASVWSAMKDLPPMPSAWFAAPTADELPPGGPGVNYKDGRVFGWVAQAGEPHAGFAKKVTIDGLGRIDTSHFLRQRFTLDDGAVVKAGAFTMNVGHHRDGAECETSACQFDNSRTVAGIVTVGMSDRGMWFSGAAAPWMSEWDRSVFMATQPSYHMKKGPSGNWQLRAVLAVPVPGHSSPLLASAVVDRSNLALTAAATMAEVEDAVAAATAVEEAATAVASDAAPVAIDYDRLADSLVAAMTRADERKAAEAAELAALLAEGRKIGADTGTVEGN